MSQVTVKAKVQAAEATEVKTEVEEVKTSLYGVDRGIVETEIPIQLHGCWQQELNKGKGGFVITSEDLDKAGLRNWAMVALSFPEIGNEGEIKVRLGLTCITGESRKVQLANGEIINSFEASVPDANLRGTNANRMVRLRSNYILLKDLLSCSNFDESEQKRIVGWCNGVINGTNSNKSMTLVPKTEEAVMAFDIKMNFHPDTGIIAKNTPIGINNFFIGDFGLLPSAAMSTFGGSFKLKKSEVVDTKVKSVEEITAVVTDEDL